RRYEFRNPDTTSIRRFGATFGRKIGGFGENSLSAFAAVLPSKKTAFAAGTTLERCDRLIRGGFRSRNRALIIPAHCSPSPEIYPLSGLVGRLISNRDSMTDRHA